jgi:hypothetical protein
MRAEGAASNDPASGSDTSVRIVRQMMLVRVMLVVDLMVLMEAALIFGDCRVPSN